jgi:hypothetical protein
VGPPEGLVSHYISDKVDLFVAPLQAGSPPFVGHSLALDPALCALLVLSLRRRTCDTTDPAFTAQTPKCGCRRIEKACPSSQSSSSPSTAFRAAAPCPTSAYEEAREEEGHQRPGSPEGVQESSRGETQRSICRQCRFEILIAPI